MSCCDEKSEPLTPFTDALHAALSGVGLLEAETIAYQEALGRVLREPIRCDRDLPACTRSRMDGYALRANEYAPESPMQVVGEVRAGDHVGRSRRSAGGGDGNGGPGPLGRGVGPEGCVVSQPDVDAGDSD